MINRVHLIQKQKTSIISLSIVILTLSIFYFTKVKTDLVKPFVSQTGTLGKVNFPVSCSTTTQASIEHGLALLHHMMYLEAEILFTTLAQTDPECAMAHWGLAVTLLHPLRSGRDFNDVLQKSGIAIQKAKTINPSTQREQAYINAIETLYKGWQTANQGKMLAAWTNAQKQLYRQFPNDTEAAVLYALSHLSIAHKNDQTFTNQRQAGELLEKLHTLYPDHPGILHYTLHAYDNPLLAKRGIKAAKTYDKVAPEVPHALHMSTHLYVRLGQWGKVIELNARSAKASFNYPVNGAISQNYLHALDYQMYAHLQRAEDNKAKDLLIELRAKDNYQKSFVSGYALAAIPARYFLERRQWQQAAQLKVRTPSTFPWEQHPELEAITYFARGYGAIMNGDIVSTEIAIDHLGELYAKNRTIGHQVWNVFIDSQGKTLAAWVALAQGNQNQALTLMRRAAELEESREKHPVTPGAVLPARELLGDMLTKIGNYPLAIEAYMDSLKVSPNRFNSLYGLANALEQQGNVTQAKNYYTKLILLAEKPESNRLEISQAKTFMKNH